MEIKYFYLVTLSFFFGVALATVFSPTLPAISAVTFFGFLFIVLWYRSTFMSETKELLFLGLLIVASALGALRLEIANWHFADSSLKAAVNEMVTITGRVVSEPEIKTSSIYFNVKSGPDTVLVSSDKFTPITYGEQVKVSGVLKRPDSFTTDLGRTFDYPGYLKAKGVEYKISGAKVEGLDNNDERWFPLTALYKLKADFMGRIELLLPEPAAGLSEGLLLGVKQALGTDLETAFRRTGIIHVVVLSGYNVMLVVLFVMYGLSFLLPKKPRTVFGIGAIIIFALLVGLSATVVRASIMATLLLIMQTTGRQFLFCAVFCWRG